MPIMLPTIGQLAERIQIVNVTGPYNQNREGVTVSTQAYTWAKIEPLMGGSVVEESTFQVHSAVQPYNIWIRYQPGITAFQQIVWNDRRLVQTAPPEEIVRKRWILIHAEETMEDAV